MWQQPTIDTYSDTGQRADDVGVLEIEVYAEWYSKQRNRLCLENDAHTKGYV